MVQVYADGRLIYDPRLDGLELISLNSTTGAATAGTAKLVLPPGHPAYNSFTAYRTEVKIYRDTNLIFRGRALYPSDDFLKRRTITCEGERGFFNDSIQRPYLHQADPGTIFRAVITAHNEQVDDFKKFAVGQVTVTDPNEYVRLESKSAEPTSDTIAKLIERCGGFLVFSDGADGTRKVSWLDTLPYRSSQIIEFGENLLDYASTDANDGLATVIIPFGAEDENGNRLTIEPVNAGRDYIQDDAAVALRGRISKVVQYDDITLASNLLTRARKDLAAAKNIITTLELSAVDLSLLDKNIDSFLVGDTIHVKSTPHSIDQDFQLIEKTEDLLDPSASQIVLGKEHASLTGSDVAGDRQSANELHQVERNIQANYQTNTASIIEETKQTLMSLIEQTAEALKLEVSETYATNDDVTRAVSTQFVQLADSFNFAFETLEAKVDKNNDSTRDEFETIRKYIRFDAGAIYLGEEGNELTLTIENDRIAFKDGGTEVAYFSNKKLVVLDGDFLHSLRIGAFEWLPRGSGNLSLIKA